MVKKAKNWVGFCKPLRPAPHKTLRQKEECCTTPYPILPVWRDPVKDQPEKKYGFEEPQVGGENPRVKR